MKKYSARGVVWHDDLKHLDFEDDDATIQEGLDRIQEVLPEGRAVSLNELIGLLDERERHGGNLIN